MTRRSNWLIRSDDDAPTYTRYELRWHSRARRDIQQIYAYIAERSLQGAQTVFDSFVKAKNDIKENPYGYRKSAYVQGLREYTHTSPYILFFCVRYDVIHLLHIRHMKRRPVYKMLQHLVLASNLNSTPDED